MLGHFQSVPVILRLSPEWAQAGQEALGTAEVGGARGLDPGSGAE